jgi:hypothetical protein
MPDPPTPSLVAAGLTGAMDAGGGTDRGVGTDVPGDPESVTLTQGSDPGEIGSLGQAAIATAPAMATQTAPVAVHRKVRFITPLPLAARQPLVVNGLQTIHLQRSSTADRSQPSHVYKPDGPSGQCQHCTTPRWIGQGSWMRKLSSEPASLVAAPAQPGACLGARRCTMTRMRGVAA